MLPHLTISPGNMKKIISLLTIFLFICSPMFASSFNDNAAATASSLVANGANCAADQAAGGVDEKGAAEACIAPVLTEVDPTVDTSAEVQAIIGAGVYATDAQGALADTAIQTELDPTVDTSAEVVAIIGAGVYQASGSYMTLAGDQTVDGIKTFQHFPVTPSANPSSDYEVANKAYVDSVAVGIVPVAHVRLASTAAGTLATDFEDGDLMDGVALYAPNRILIKDQADPIENGIYVVQASGAPVRAADYDTDAEVVGGTFMYVKFGTANAGSQFIQTTTAPEVGVDPLVFTLLYSPQLVEVDPTVDTSAEIQAIIGAGVYATDAQGALADTAIQTELDPKIGTLTNTKWCTTNGTTVACTSNAPVTTELDPTVDTSSEIQAIIGAHVYMEMVQDHATLSSSATQSAASTTTAYPITFNTNDDITGIVHSTVVNPSQITLVKAGEYVVAVSAIFKNTQNSQYVDLWFRLDGVDIPRSNTKMAFAGTGNEIPLAVTFNVDATAGQVLEVVWHSSHTGTTLIATSAASNPTRPASPSIIIAINRLGEV